MKELAALAYRDNLPESRDFWKNEMAQAIREIEQMYADKLETMKTEMESSYNLKVCNDVDLPSVGITNKLMGAAMTSDSEPRKFGTSL